jgi:hypothetical protein
MMNQSSLCYLINICTALVLILLWGCHADPPHGKRKRSAMNTVLMKQLTCADEAERFKALKKALHQEASISREDVEDVLIALGDKNVSTLIYLFMKSDNALLYHISPPAKMALENSQGSFPNIAYYYAKVNSSDGIRELNLLYERYQEKRMAVCLALGSIKSDDAFKLLLTKAKSEKERGNNILAQLCGLKGTLRPLSSDSALSFLNKKLDREEVITLSEIPATLTYEQHKQLWTSNGPKKTYVVQSVLGNPVKYFETLRWIVEQLKQAGDGEAIRQLMLSDGMRNVTKSEVKQYRNDILKELNGSGG